MLLKRGCGVFVGNGCELSLSPKEAILRKTQARHAAVKFKLSVFTAAFNSWVAALPPS